VSAAASRSLELFQLWSGKLYWYGISRDPMVESDLSGNVTGEFIFFNGQRIARRTSGGSV